VTLMPWFDVAWLEVDGGGVHAVRLRTRTMVMDTPTFRPVIQWHR